MQRSSLHSRDALVLTVPGVLVFASLLLSAALLTSAASATAQQPEKLLYQFQNGSDGAVPSGSLVVDKDGNLYGVTQDAAGYPCTALCGNVFEVSPPAGNGGAWAFQVLYSFDCGAGGGFPHGNVIFGPDGSLYGTGVCGGEYAHEASGGVVFRLKRPAGTGGVWTETVLHSFGLGDDGTAPQGGLAFDSKGDIYGTTFDGGEYGEGVVYEVSPPAQSGGPWTESVLHSFGNGDDGYWPDAGVAIDSAGNLYGTTEFGGFYSSYCSGGCGTVFEVSPPATEGGAWTYAAIYQFEGYDGASPLDPLTFDENGNLYGTTSLGLIGGSAEAGSVFELSPPAVEGEPWQETLLYGFQPYPYDPDYPSAGVIFDEAGNLYGTSQNGGLSYQGTAFKVLPPATQGGSWTDAILYSFSSKKSGATYPSTSLVFGKDGTLYGTTPYGGNGPCTFGKITGCGTVFAVAP
jgi:uncharacterized repeat protein (TIGR03803 family)